MLSTGELWTQYINGNRYCSRRIIVAYLKAAAAEAKRFPLNELAQRNTTGRFGDLEGERIVGGMTTVLAMQAWIDSDTSPDLEEILGILGPLDSTETDNKKLWLELFAKIDKLDS
jgi:hypothetical protein